MTIRWLRVVLFIHVALNVALGIWLWLIVIGMFGLEPNDYIDQSGLTHGYIFLVLYSAPALPLALIAGILIERRPDTARKMLIATWTIACLQAIIAILISMVLRWTQPYLVASLACPVVLFLEFALAGQADSREWLRRTTWRPPG